jgi:hypothetical protein
MEPGVTTTRGVALTFPAQFVHVPLAQAATPHPHPYCE